jgi:hypothetical protein
MTLQTLETKWRGNLAGENCPPVLGLAPLSEEESEVIRQIVAAELEQHLHSPWQTLFALLQKFPACLAVWLARKAGEAYEAGAFWEKFGALTGVSIPLNQRAEFAQHFRRACRKTMAAWLPPEELGGHNIVAEFLHQAGLPLDRCETRMLLTPASSYARTCLTAFSQFQSPPLNALFAALPDRASAKWRLTWYG